MQQALASSPIAPRRFTPLGHGRKRPFKPRNRGKTEERIAGAALKVFAEKGYDRATVQELADAAGIVRGTLYQYCPTKEDVLLLMLQRAKVEQDEALVPPPGESTLETIDRIIEARVCYLERLRPILDALGRRKVEEIVALVEARLAPERHRTLEQVEAVLRSGVERGELRAIDPYLSSRLLAGMLTPLVYQEALRGGYRPAEIMRAARDLIRHGLVEDDAAG
jgi:AcrR family transcriptional regulator